MEMIVDETRAAVMKININNQLENECKTKRYFVFSWACVKHSSVGRTLSVFFPASYCFRALLSISINFEVRTQITGNRNIISD